MSMPLVENDKNERIIEQKRILVILFTQKSSYEYMICKKKKIKKRIFSS